MHIRVISFTKAGQNLSIKIKEILEAEEHSIFESLSGLKKQEPLEVSLFTKCRFRQYGLEDKIHVLDGSLQEFAREAFEKKNPIFFIGACGIAVRTIASFVKDKKTDPPVLVLDEKGRFVIPLLSSHLGGGERLAELLANSLNAILVNTTSSDVNRLFAVDVFAKENGLKIQSMEKAKDVAACIVNGEKCHLAFSEKEFEIEGDVPDEILTSQDASTAIEIQISNRKQKEDGLQLIPRNVILGIGCKKGKSSQDIMALVLYVLDQMNILPDAVKCIGSIDLKKEEQGLLETAEFLNVPFRAFSAEELDAQCLPEGNFSRSEFVQSVAGVSNVCERAAMAAGADYLIQKKVSYQGMTIAVGIQKGKICFE